MKFSKPLYYPFGNYSTYMGYDSGYIYHSSGVSNMVCYNASTGVWLWSYAYGFGVSGTPMVGAQKMAFNDSMLFVVQTYFTDTYVYCLNKKTGKLKWKEYLFSDVSGFSVVNYKPVVASDRVIVTGRRSSDNRPVIKCFNAITGQNLWSYVTSSNSAWTSEFEIYNGTVISWGPKATCLNIADGSLRWEAVIPAGTGYLHSANYFPDGSKTLVAWSLNSNGYCYWFNKSDGTIASSHIFPRAYSRAVYKDNNIVLLYGQPTTDNSLFLKRFDTQNFSENWNCALPKYFTGTVPNQYYSHMVLVDNKLVFSENASELSPNHKEKFNVINFSTGVLEKELFTKIKLPLNYIMVVKSGKAYLPTY